MEALGPQDRALFESANTQLYEEIVGSGGLADGDARILPGGELHDALEQLRAMGLVQHDNDTNTWVAEDPHTVQARVISPLSTEGRTVRRRSQAS